MAYSAITAGEVDSDSPITATLMGKMKDNFIDHENRISVLAQAGIPNSSFEVDADADSVPDNWTRNLFNGGAGAYSTTDFVLGTKSYKLTRLSGATYGAGSLTSDYVECSFLEELNLGIAFKSSAASVKNSVYIRFFDKDKVEMATGYWYTSGTGRQLWTKSDSMPLFWTWLRILKVGVPISARYYKIIFAAGEVDATYNAAADIYVDRITNDPAALGYGILGETIDQAEVTNTSATFADIGSTYSITVPAAAKYLDVEIQVKDGYTTENYFASGRAAIGTTYGTAVTGTVDGVYQSGVSRIDVSALSGVQTMKFQLKNMSGAWNSYLKSVASESLKYYSLPLITVDSSTRTTTEVI